ncbi:hypothetical protein L208DRAFT_1411173 [Tricholoma matsutake]|nr:hypothetical protein L208DRAFT_1411173 [Tricholoma matsutake 945]
MNVNFHAYLGQKKLILFDAVQLQYHPCFFCHATIPSDTHSKNVRLTKVTIASTAIPSTVAALYHCPPCHFRDEAHHFVEFELAGTLCHVNRILPSPPVV